MTENPTELVLCGGGGHALVVAEAALIAGMRLIGFTDDDPGAPVGARFDLRHLGPVASTARVPAPAILAIGDIRARRRVIDTLGPGGRWRSVTHPSAFVSPSAVIGPGSFIGPRAVVHSFAVLGAHAIVNSGAIVEHECSIGENSHVAPGAVLAGRVRIGPDSLVGIAARVLPNLSIGASSTVGAGSVVLTSIDAGVTVAGCPARALH